MSDSREALRAEIAGTRTELAETAAALTARTDVKQATAERVARVAESAAEVTARIGRSPKFVIAAVCLAGAALAVLARRRR